MIRQVLSRSKMVCGGHAGQSCFSLDCGVLIYVTPKKSPRKSAGAAGSSPTCLWGSCRPYPQRVSVSRSAPACRRVASTRTALATRAFPIVRAVRESSRGSARQHGLRRPFPDRQSSRRPQLVVLVHQRVDAQVRLVAPGRFDLQLRLDLGHTGGATVFLDEESSLPCIPDGVCAGQVVHVRAVLVFEGVLVADLGRFPHDVHEFSQSTAPLLAPTNSASSRLASSKASRRAASSNSHHACFSYAICG